MAAWVAFCAAWEVTRPRPSEAFFVVEEALFAAGADFVLLAALRGPLARVLAALLREAALVPLEAMVLAAWVLAEALGFFAAVEDLLAVLLFAAGADFVLLALLRVPLAKVLAALLREEALLPSLARVLAALLLLAVLVDLLVGICVSLLSSNLMFLLTHRKHS